MRKETLKNMLRRFVLVSAMGVLMMSGGTAAYGQDRVVVIPLFEDTQPSAGLNAPVPKTGQTVIYESNDDGYFKKGVASPTPRFTNNGDGTVTDHLTNLIWLQEGNCIEFYPGDTTGENKRSWVKAVQSAKQLADPKCGLTDGSLAGDWRLPNRRELDSLVDLGHVWPALPANSYLTNTFNNGYWSSTTIDSYTTMAWLVGFEFGGVNPGNKVDAFYVRAVRGGQ